MRLPALLIVAMLIDAAAAQSPMFSTRREAVRVDVFVSANGQPVRNLRPQDFDVRDNGVRQTVDLAAFEAVALNLVLAFDMSGNVAGERLEHLRSGGRALLDALRPDDRAALVTFSHVVTQHSDLTSNRAAVGAALNGVAGSGETSLIDGIYASVIAAGHDGRGLVIVFSDGLDTTSWLSAAALIDTARRSDVVIYTVAAQHSGSTALLQEVSRATGGSLLLVESTRQLDGAFLRILDEYRHRYLLSYSPVGVDQRGWHRLDVRIRGARATVRARPGYFR